MVTGGTSLMMEMLPSLPNLNKMNMMEKVRQRKKQGSPTVEVNAIIEIKKHLEVLAQKTV